MKVDSGLTDCAVFSIEAGAGTVTLILVLAVANTHTPVLTGEVTAWVHCGKKNTKETHVKLQTKLWLELLTITRTLV